MIFNICATCGAKHQLRQRVLLSPSVDPPMKALETTVCATCDERLAQGVNVADHDAYLRPLVHALLRDSEEPLQLQQIADWLNEAGYPTPTGRRWTPSSVFKMLNRVGLTRVQRDPLEEAEVPMPLATVEDDDFFTVGNAF